MLSELEQKGYILAGCKHYLFVSADGLPFNDMRQELDAVQGREFINHDEYQHVTDGQNTLIVYTDPDQPQAHMNDLSPSDGDEASPAILPRNSLHYCLDEVFEPVMLHGDFD